MRRGLTITEIMIGLSLFLMVGIYFFQTLRVVGRAEKSTSKKLLAARTLQYIQGRIRRDVKWARKITSANSGKKLILKDLAGATRTYEWKADKYLYVPRLGSPGVSEKYGQAKFRIVKFYFNEHRSEGVRVILSPLPPEENEAIAGSYQEVVWGAAMVGRAEAQPRSVAHRYGLYNEPAFSSPVPEAELLE